jgi:hypothetical protein
VCGWQCSATCFRPLLSSAGPACREAEYTEYRPLRLFVGTWNVNGKTPRESLTPWLNDGVDADAEGRLDLPDIYVIG